MKFTNGELMVGCFDHLRKNIECNLLKYLIFFKFKSAPELMLDLTSQSSDGEVLLGPSKDILFPQVTQ